MTLATLHAWLLALLFAAQPHAPASLLATYSTTAEAMARVVATEDPLFAGPHGREQTAALLVETATEEGALRADAVGDHGASACMTQIHESNFARLGVTRAQLLTDLDACLRTGLRMMRESFAACRERPFDERLSAYLAGGAGCSDDERVVRRSRYRMHRAMRLLKEHPPPDPGNVAAVAPPT